MAPFLQNLKQLPARSKAAFAISAAAILAIVVLLLQVAGAPSYTTLVSGVEPKQTGEVTAALDEQGIPYELQANGTTVAVDKASLAKARVALATAGVSAGAEGGEGYELFDAQKLGASEMQERVTLQRALEGEIARTIGAIDGVNGAQVQLVLPEEELFADGETPTTAAVMLEGSSMLEEGSVRGIAQLVASSVKGLKTENVTITDATGQMLWPQEGADAGGGMGASTKQAMEARYERSVEANLNAMLARTLGPDKAQVQVKAALNVDKTKRNQLTYAKRGVPLEVSEEREQLEGGGAGGGNNAGTDTNIPTYAQNAAGGGAGSEYRRDTETRKMALDKVVEETEVAPGAVEGVKVALLVDDSVDAATFAKLEGIVERAAGMDPARGDDVESLQVAFPAAAEEPKAGPVPATMIEPLKWVGVGLASLVFLFLMMRGLRRREAEELPTPAWLTQISEPTPLAALEAAKPDPPTMVLKEREPNFQLQTMEHLVEREPERVAAQVKAWMSEG